MIVNAMRPNTLVIKLTPTMTDPEYELFSWVQFYFDCDKWQLYVTTDECGYTFNWTPKPEQSFLKKLSDMSTEYLMGKLGSKVFSLGQSIRTTQLNLKAFFSEEEEPIIFGYIHRLCGERECVDEAVFYNSAKQILTQKNLYYDSKNRLAVESELDSIIGLVMVFPPSLMAIGKLFDEHIRPKLK